MSMRTKVVRRALGIGLAGIAIAAMTATPVHAYGQATWQTTFAGTGTVPGSGGFGFWGWCDFGGGVTSGSSGDCQFAQYFHGTGGAGITCHVSMDFSWFVGSNGDFFGTGTATANPSSLSGPCLGTFPGGPSYTAVDIGIPAAPGHYNLGGIGGLVGEFQMQVTEIG